MKKKQKKKKQNKNLGGRGRLGAVGKGWCVREKEGLMLWVFLSS